jgi:putative addiction module antidote
MNKPLKVVRIGNSAGVILPRDLLAKLHAEPGGMISVEANDDGVRLKPFEADFEAQMAAARDVMERRKRALRELAK